MRVERDPSEYTTSQLVHEISMFAFAKLMVIHGGGMEHACQDEQEDYLLSKMRGNEAFIVDAYRIKSLMLELNRRVPSRLTPERAFSQLGDALGAEAKAQEAALAKKVKP